MINRHAYESWEFVNPELNLSTYIQSFTVEAFYKTRKTFHGFCNVAFLQLVFHSKICCLLLDFHCLSLFLRIGYVGLA